MQGKWEDNYIYAEAVGNPVFDLVNSEDVS